MQNQYWNGKYVLVTGAGGFIASHLVEALLQEGAWVRAFVRYNSRGQVGYLDEIRSKPGLEIVAGDLRDGEAMAQAVNGVEVVFHLGALISIPYSYVHPREVVETNLIGTLNVLTAAKLGKIRRLVHASSSEVYGTAISVPMDEAHPLQGQSPYSASKIGADKLVESFFCSYALPAVTIRPFNTYGPRQSARAVIAAIVIQALTREVIRLGNLDTRRDFTYVEDTVRGFLLAGQSEKVDGLVINLGTGRDISIGELAEKIIGIIGRKVQIERDDQRMRPEGSEVMRLISDNRLAEEALNWKPEVTLENGLVKTIAWIAQNIDRYNPDRYSF